MKYNIGDTVTYVGSNKSLQGNEGKVIRTKEKASLENDISRGGAVVYPKEGFDYTIQFTRVGTVRGVLDVTEDELE